MYQGEEETIEVLVQVVSGWEERQGRPSDRLYQGERKDESGASTGCIRVREKTRAVLAQVVSG